MPPLVTIITVTYNRAHILPRSITSVLDQDYPNLRLLIVDDGSTDRTGEILESFAADSRVEVLRHPTNRGVIAARNTSLAHLGEDVAYFGYNDSDDLLLPGAVTRAVDVLEGGNGRWSMLYAWAEDAASGELQGGLRGKAGEPRTTGEIAQDDYLDYRIAGDWFQLIRRDLLGSMRYDERASGGEGILWARILRYKPGILIEDTLQLKDRAGTDRVSKSNVRHDRAAAEARMWLYSHELETLGSDMRKAYPRSYAMLLTRLAHSASMAGDSRRARSAAREALRTEPSPITLAVVGASLSPAMVVRGATRLAARWTRRGRRRLT